MRTGLPPEQLEAALPLNEVDPGEPGTHATVTGEYDLDAVKLPGLPEPVEMRAVVVDPVDAPFGRPPISRSAPSGHREPELRLIRLMARARFHPCVGLFLPRRMQRVPQPPSGEGATPREPIPADGDRFEDPPRTITEVGLMSVLDPTTAAAMRPALAEAPPADGTAPRERRWRARWIVPTALGVGYVLSVVFRLSLVTGQDFPTVNPDEEMYLVMARILAGLPTTEIPGNQIIPSGYSLLISPALRITQEPVYAYHLVMGINALISCLVLPVAYWALRRLNVSRAVSYVAGVAVTLLPPVLFYRGPGSARRGHRGGHPVQRRQGPLERQLARRAAGLAHRQGRPGGRLRRMAPLVPRGTSPRAGLRWVTRPGGPSTVRQDRPRPCPEQVDAVVAAWAGPPRNVAR